MPTRRLLFLAIAMSLSFQVALQAQTYATPELKKQVEAEQAAQLQKIPKGPESYRAQGGNPEQVLITKPAEKTAPVTYASPVDVNRPDLYKLAAVDAVDLNNKHTAQEMTAFQSEAEGVIKTMNIVLDWKSRSWYLIPRDNQKEPGEKKFRVEGSLLQFLDCLECQDNTFTITEHTENALILQLQPQDEGRFFVYALTFLK